MDNEKLIEAVRNYTFLYDISDKRYSDNQKKDVAWREISKKLKMDDKACRKAWALLRDAFRRAIKKRKKLKSGQANVALKKWKYEEEMSFLLPHCKERPILYSVGKQNEKNIVRTHGENNVAKTMNENNDHSDNSIVDENNEKLSTSPASTPTSISKCHRSVSFTTKKLEHEEIPSTVLMKYLLESNNKVDEIEQFFGSIATIVKSFPLIDRAIAKAKVFEVISQMEIDILSRPSISSDSSSMSFNSYKESR